MFDGHGPWGHKITKRVKKLFPASLLCQWQQTLASLSSSPECSSPFDLWKQACMKTFSIIDLDLKIHPSIDSYCSGCTALTAILQGDHLVVANAGDSRAVIATTSDDGVGLVPVQLSVDFKPNIPEEAERIKQSDGRLFCLDDEPGVYRVGMPNGRSLGLAVSRAFGDYCLKDFGLVSEPEVTYRKITSKDQFLILATDGMWDVMKNDEAVEIVRGVKDRKKSAERLVKKAMMLWRKKRSSIAMDDISALCLFFHPC
ncbi:probable protein phosphatase 2C 41 isoform X2 [Brassica rapa]|nr:probable protein phosphatase 2C 41 isoform X2 [Brassica rapa]